MIAGSPSNAVTTTRDGARLPLRRAPTWFEHTEEVLTRELGVDAERFAQLVVEGVLY